MNTRCRGDGDAARCAGACPTRDADEATTHADIAEAVGGLSCRRGEHLGAVAINALHSAVDLAGPCRPLAGCQRDRPLAELNRSDEPVQRLPASPLRSG